MIQISEVNKDAFVVMVQAAFATYWLQFGASQMLLMMSQKCNFQRNKLRCDIAIAACDGNTKLVRQCSPDHILNKVAAEVCCSYIFCCFFILLTFDLLLVIFTNFKLLLDMHCLTCWYFLFGQNSHLAKHSFIPTYISIILGLVKNLLVPLFF